jgi:hypothetical protein
MPAATDPVPRSRRAARAVAALAPLWLLVSACILDWERDDGSSGGGQVDVCPPMTTCTCTPGEPCKYSCLSDACVVDCNGATTCEVFCTGASCLMTCSGNVDCKQTCTGAEPCELQCSDGAACSQTCLSSQCTCDGC